MKLPSLIDRQLVRRKCPVCGWEAERIEDAATDTACPLCKSPTTLEELLPLPSDVDLADVPRAKNIYAAALGQLGGRKGGPARAKKLSAARRREIARKAARARWKKAARAKSK